MKKGALNRLIRIQRPVADDSFDGAGSGTWPLVAEVRASVQDALPSRGERLAEGINASNRPARVRIRYRRDVASEMRIEIGHYEEGDPGESVWVIDRTAQIITEPAEIGTREGLEFMIEDYRPAGNSA